MNREVVFIRWALRVRLKAIDARIDAWVIRTCPDLPNFRGRDVTLAFAPSLLAAYVLRVFMPLMVAARAFSVHRVAIALVAGRIACAVGERLGLRRADDAYARWWSRRALNPHPSARRVVVAAERIGERARDWAVPAFVVGALLAAVAIGMRTVTGARGVSAPIGISALLVLSAACVLAIGMLFAMTVESLAPFILGPPSPVAHVVSRDDLRRFRPLLRTWPLRLAQDAWELLRTLRV